MIRTIKKNQSGYTLIEVLIALGIFVIVTVAASLLLIQALDDSFASSKRVKGLYLAREGVEVVRNMRNIDYDLLIDGTYSLRRGNTVWSFVPVYEDTSGYTRTVDISSRVDGSKYIESNVEWSAMANRSQFSHLSIVLTDWKQTGGNSGDVVFDTSLVELVAGTNLAGIKLENTGDMSQTVSYIEVQWEGGGVLYKIEIDGDLVFDVDPSEGVSSGSVIDITNTILVENYGEISSNFIFDTLELDTDVLVIFIFDDGSKKYIHVSV